MKSYTNIEQSKKLAEILPIKSADMYYTVCPDAEDNSHDGYDDVRIRIENPFGDEFKKWYSCYTEIDWYDSPYIPCWSLAALLEVLLCPSLCNTFGEWRCQCYKEGHIIATSYADNPVDACYEMIIKLNEQKLL